MRLTKSTERQKIAENSPSGHCRITLSGYIFATKARIDNPKIVNRKIDNRQS